MPSLTIDNNETSFSYLDSGKPQREIYTTFVVIHGHTFHSNIFRHMFPFALSHGLRLVCLNRRDYGQSTPYNPGELKVLAEGTEAERTSFMEARGIEIAEFLCRLIDELSLPAPTGDCRDGGIALVGWSFGNATSIAAVASAPSTPPKTQQRLQAYLRRLLIFAPPNVALGFPGLPNVHTPLEDDTVPPEDRGRLFVEWVSSYYTHGDLSSHDPTVLNTQNSDIGRKSSVASMSAEDFLSVVDFVPGNGSDFFLLTQFSTQFNKQVRKAVFDPRGRDLWPNLAIWFLYGDKEPWNVQYSAWKVEERAKENGSDVKFHMISGANHFVVWDEPAKAVNAMLYTLRSVPP